MGITDNSKKRTISMDGNPRVSIGLPVFNGETYLKEALDSILAQTYQNFELIISDNASTDRTQQICRQYADKDSRIHYYRNEKNIGAPKNFNRVFELSSSEFFKWAACDDVHAPTYLQKCMAILNTDPSIIICHSKTGRINEQSKLIGHYNGTILARISSWKPDERFGEFLSICNPVWALYGVIRSDLLSRTPLHGSYIGSDRNLIAELALLGRIYEIPEFLFFGREHPQSYTSKFYGAEYTATEDNFRNQIAWWAQGDQGNFPTLRNCSELLRSIRRVKLKWLEKLLCYNQVFKWFVKEGLSFTENDLENLFMRRSTYGYMLILAIKSILKRTIIPKLKKTAIV